ncbi:MAG: fused MFS/spermidine synthase [Polaromonas sp.]
MQPWPLIDKLPTGIAGRAATDAQNLAKPFVHDDGQIRSLHFSMGELQSQMNLQNPSHLQVDYTHTMMGFLLLHSAPASIGMVGLGGGSLVKFCHAQLPASSLTVIEINPHVIALRRQFAVPDDDARLEVLEADGATYLALQTARFDVLLIDGFDLLGQPPALCTQAFYDDCFAALKPDGVLVVNLHYDDADYPVWAERLQRSFGGNACEVPAPEKSNGIVFATRMDTRAPMSPRSLNLQASLSGLTPEARGQLKPEFSRILWSMKDLGGSDGV